jgi:hypothetical protein
LAAREAQSAMEHVDMTILEMTLVSSTVLVLMGCIVPDPFYGGPAYYSAGPRYYGASPYVGGTQIDRFDEHRFDEHRGEGRGRYEGREQ